MKMKQSFKIIFKTLLIYLVLWLDFWYFYILNGEYQNSETSSQSTLNQVSLSVAKLFLLWHFTLTI